MKQKIGSFMKRTSAFNHKHPRLLLWHKNPPSLCSASHTKWELRCLQTSSCTMEMQMSPFFLKRWGSIVRGYSWSVTDIPQGRRRRRSLPGNMSWTEAELIQENMKLRTQMTQLAARASVIEGDLIKVKKCSKKRWISLLNMIIT